MIPIAPTNITTVLITGGVRITWIDNSNNEYGFEIWASVDGGAFTLIHTTLPGVQTYDHIRDNGVDMVYKVRAKAGISFSNFRNVSAPLPLTFNLTSGGIGAGIMTVRFRVSETTTATLSGTARFYTNLAGTTGESTTWIITSGALRTMYLKVPSGTATLKVKNVITEWGGIYGSCGWEMPSGAGWENYPFVDIDIALLTHLTKVNIFGNNTIHGDISGLTGLTFTCFGNGYGGSNNSIAGCTITGSIAGMLSLTNLDIWDNNTIYGDISGLSLLTVLWVGGSNTISGSLTGMTQLTFVEILGLNTLSGLVTNLTLLTTLVLGGNNTCSGSVAALTLLTNLQIKPLTGTSAINGSVAGLSVLGMLVSYGSGISGSIAGLTSLYYVYLSGTNSLSGAIIGLINSAYFVDYSDSTITFANVTNLTKLSAFDIQNKTLLAANVNQILADFWANKDVAKTYSYRYIDMHHSAAPTGQGLTDKAALQAYRSPTPPGTADLWTVLTA